MLHKRPWKACIFVFHWHLSWSTSSDSLILPSIHWYWYWQFPLPFIDIGIGYGGWVLLWHEDSSQGGRLKKRWERTSGQFLSSSLLLPKERWSRIPSLSLSESSYNKQGKAFNLYALAKRVEAIGRPYAKDMDTLFSVFSLFLLSNNSFTKLWN